MESYDEEQLISTQYLASFYWAVMMTTGLNTPLGPGPRGGQIVYDCVVTFLGVCMQVGVLPRDSHEAVGRSYMYVRLRCHLPRVAGVHALRGGVRNRKDGREGRAPKAEAGRDQAVPSLAPRALLPQAAHHVPLHAVTCRYTP